MTRDLMPSALDKHISASKDDAFGHRHFAQALRSLIESPKNLPPYSIGLLGGWGTGKSSIKELYIHDLEDDSQKYNKKLRKNCIKYITFNAWRFGGKDQDIKRALLRHVFIELGGTDEVINKELFCNVSETIKKRYRFLEFLKESLFSSLYTLVPIIIPLILCLLVIKIGNLTDNIVIGALVFVTVSAFAIVFKRYRIHSLDPYYTQTVLQLPATSTERYEQLLQIQLAEFKNGNGRDYDRIVVFVDDLDRLSAEEMVSGLDAVRTFMEMPLGSMEGKIGIVFVISCDEAKVADALGSKGRKQSDIPGAVFNSSDARRYLDRIFQFRLEIPPFPRQDMRNFALEKLRDLQLPEFDEKLIDSGTPLETLVEYMIHADVQNPRNAIQIVNAFSQAWWLAKQRESEGIMNDLPGGLHEDAVTGQPIVLAIISAIKVNFPDFYKDIQSYPDLLLAYIDVIIRGQNIDDQPHDIKTLLAESYRQDDSGTPAEKKIKRSLQRFLASLQGVRWPASLQPYIFLSEDPTSRQFGDKWIQAYIDLISSNTNGLLDNLGISQDESALAAKEAGILLQLFEKARDESQIRKDNASRVVADILPRITDAQAQSLISALSREVCDSKQLRSRLGVGRIANIVNRAAIIDKQDIVAELIQDVLNVEHDVDMPLESLQNPSLDEAVAMVKGALGLALEVNEHYSLHSGSLNKLHAWLLARTVKIGEKEYAFPYDDFEDWLNEYQGSLLRLLRQDYTQALYEELSKKEPTDFDLPKSLQRAKEVFNTLQSEGEESRAVLWKQLGQYVRLQRAEPVQLAWETALQYVDSPVQGDLSEFIINLSGRIARIEHDADTKQFDLPPLAASLALLQIITKRIDAVDSDSTPDILSAVNRMADLEKSSKVGCDILGIIRPIDSDVEKEALSEWASRLPSLAEHALVFFFQNIQVLDAEKIKPVSDFFQTEVLM
ncbi:KAP family NTPase [Desulfovibrio sp. OttesenSCG-928-I05]|nr:KAP family NTPase [Desulfovibrio sp. OttesenSCG-928-O18]MDL2271900.1 KAP family NTPase [Desulfovibrio sp. OttesenSCG-928-I05]